MAPSSLQLTVSKAGVERQWPTGSRRRLPSATGGPCTDEIVTYAALPGGMGAAEEKMKKRPPAERAARGPADLLEKIKLEN